MRGLVQINEMTNSAINIILHGLSVTEYSDCVVLLWYMKVLMVALIHALRTKSLDLNAYFPDCQLSLNATTEKPQVGEMTSCH